MRPYSTSSSSLYIMRQSLGIIISTTVLLCICCLVTDVSIASKYFIILLILVSFLFEYSKEWVKRWHIEERWAEGGRGYDTDVRDECGQWVKLLQHDTADIFCQVMILASRQLPWNVDIKSGHLDSLELLRMSLIAECKPVNVLSMIRKQVLSVK